MTAQSVGEIIKNGIVFDLKNWSSKMPPSDDLARNVENLFQLLNERQIDYLLVGGIALLSYIDGRNTQDIDFIMSQSALYNLPELEVIEENRDFARANFNSLQVDILLTNNNLCKTVQIECSSQQKFGNLTVPTSTVEGLILLKLYALPSLCRQEKFDKVSIYETDILLLLLRHSVDIDKVLRKLAKHVLDTDLEEINQIVLDIQNRMQRFQR